MSLANIIQFNFTLRINPFSVKLFVDRGTIFFCVTIRFRTVPIRILNRCKCWRPYPFVWMTIGCSYPCINNIVLLNKILYYKIIPLQTKLHIIYNKAAVLFTTELHVHRKKTMISETKVCIVILWCLHKFMRRERESNFFNLPFNFDINQLFSLTSLMVTSDEYSARQYLCKIWKENCKLKTKYNMPKFK